MWESGDKEGSHMARQSKNFKKLIRSRMEETGESYQNTRRRLSMELLLRRADGQIDEYVKEEDHDDDN